jgi:DNA-binding transcriptional MerR regulator
VIFPAYAFTRCDRIICNPEKDDMNYKEDIQILREAGFTEAEIRRLCELRRILAEEGKYLEFVDYRRLEFARWLVATGKLTEQVA